MGTRSLPKSLIERADRSASPGTVTTSLARLTEDRGDLSGRLEADARLADVLVAVLAASRSLSRLLNAEKQAIEVLSDLDARPKGDLGTQAGLAAWKRLELLRIAARDLAELDSLETVGAKLAALADDVLSSACAVASGRHSPALAVIGMGKLGGLELNYASDIDVLFVGPGGADRSEPAARRVLETARSCFRVDVDLRPEGRDGPLVRSVASYKAYWERWAQAWEFQALIKARHAAGVLELGREFVAAASERLWSRAFGTDELRQVRDMKARSEGEMNKRGLADREVKRGRGGIRDIEMAVQILQLVHGRHDPAIRSQSTLETLAELGAAGYVGADEARSLSQAYRFLRTVEHRLQLVEEAQVHTVPEQPAAREHLARIMGYRDAASSTALEQFDEDLSRHRSTVRYIHERVFFRPLLEAFARLDQPRTRQPRPAEAASAGAEEMTLPVVMTLEAAKERLVAFGFSDAERTRIALRELTRGLTRSSRLMHQMLPLLLEWLSETPDPDLGLLGLRRLVAGGHQPTQLVTRFRDSPETARRLCVLLGTSGLLLDPIRRNPELIADLGDDQALVPRTREALLEQSGITLGWRAAPGDRAAGLRRLTETETVRIAARDLLGLDDVSATGTALSALAEAVMEAALLIVRPPVRMAVIAMGRFGGAELSYASDLDVLLVFDGEGHDAVVAAEEAGASLLRLMNGDTPSERIWHLDPGLRPEGTKGPLVRSLDGYSAYYSRWAQVWELQALVRARPVAGDRAVAERFMDLIERFVWSSPLDEASKREIRRMKARVERERIPPGEDRQFHLKLGRGSLSDVEWTAQLLQMEHSVKSQGTVAALEALVAAGVMSSADAGMLFEAYRFCERTRNRWFLIRGSPGDSLPTQAGQLARLARSFNTTPGGLRESYRQVTRRARQVMERLFYRMDV